MKGWIKAVVDFYIYSSLHISIAATLFACELNLIQNIAIDWHYLGLVFSSTLFIYSIHRIVGIKKIDPLFKNNRFETIRKFKSHLIIYSVLAILAVTYCALQIRFYTILLLIVPAFISILYTLPLFTKGKRLRDFNYIKIFLIALVWTIISVAIPVLSSYPEHPFADILIFFPEHFLFMLMITLPFDVRDLEIDNSKEVKTIPYSMGLKKTKNLIIGIATISILWLLLLSQLDFRSPYIGLVLVYCISLIAIFKSINKKSDYWFSGVLDGMFIVRGLVVIFWTHLL